MPLAPSGTKQMNEIEPNATPTKPENATTENVEVPARPVVAISGQSSYDEAFKSIKASLEAVEKAMGKAGVKPTGHPITIFSAPDDKGFKYQAGVPVAQKPEKSDLGGGVAVVMSPAGKAIKFQHRGAYDDIDSHLRRHHRLPRRQGPASRQSLYRGISDRADHRRRSKPAGRHLRLREVTYVFVK